jgi:hypothetical protein
VLPALLERGLLSFEPLVEGALAADLVGTSPGVVLSLGATADGDLLQQSAALVDVLVDADLPLVVAEAYDPPDDPDARSRGELALAAVPEGSRTAVAIVDHLEQRAGQVAAVLALADAAGGVIGYYGYGDGSAGVVPTWTPLTTVPEAP